MNRNEIIARARALGLSATATDACARNGIPPDRYVAFRREMDEKSPNGTQAARRAQGRAAMDEANGRRDVAFSTGPALMTPHRVGQVRAKPAPSELETRIEALETYSARRAREARQGPLPEVSASMRARLVEQSIDPDEFAKFRAAMRRSA